ncbi:MAG: FmdE family protein [Planctomycetota bacterium]|nr:FmdE family protein [Planctomycetota bacterium]
MKKETRSEIVRRIKAKDLKWLLEKAGELHGHFCPGLALGVKAAYAAIIRLRKYENFGMEDLLAIVECNNCFADGIQIVTGCSFGNNSLIYLDLGKTAFTLVERNTGKGIRVAKKPESQSQRSFLDEKTRRLFEKVVKKRKGTPEEEEKLRTLWEENSFRILEIPETGLFNIKKVTPEIPPFAPIVDSGTCHKCGEEAMETRLVLVEGKPTCLTCAGAEFRILAGKGIYTSCIKTNR